MAVLAIKELLSGKFGYNAKCAVAGLCIMSGPPGWAGLVLLVCWLISQNNKAMKLEKEANAAKAVQEEILRK